MKSFHYVITDTEGLHARPAGTLVKNASAFKSDITLSKGNRKADAKRLFAIMGLGVKTGETVTLSIDGEDEEKAKEVLQKFMEENL